MLLSTIIKLQYTDKKTKIEVTQLWCSIVRNTHRVCVCMWLKVIVNKIHCQILTEMLFKSQMKRSSLIHDEK